MGLTGNIFKICAARIRKRDLFQGEGWLPVVETEGRFAILQAEQCTERGGQAVGGTAKVLQRLPGWQILSVSSPGALGRWCTGAQLLSRGLDLES